MNDGEEVKLLMYYDDPTRQRGGQNPDDDTTGQKGGQTGTDDNLGNIGEGLGGMEDVTTEDEVEDIDKSTS